MTHSITSQAQKCKIFSNEALDGFFHFRCFGKVKRRGQKGIPLRLVFCPLLKFLAYLGYLLACQNKQAGDEDAFGYLAILVGGGLEGLTGRSREAVQVEAIVPVGAADERQPMGAKTVERVLNGALKMLEERGLTARLIVIRRCCFQNAPIGGFLK